MATFELNSIIKIGTFQFAGVHKVGIRRSLHSYVDTAEIQIPALAKITQGARKSASLLQTKSLFTEGDPVSIQLGYNGKLVEEFRGFYKRGSLGQTLTVEAEGYVYQLRRNRIKGSFKQVTVKELLAAAV
ncbi:MAG: hypothetical protein EBZ77_15335, partial [Chitinophagia bacterium]|nr:hypothetical protein [Chitinophagia bacterium]